MIKCPKCESLDIVKRGFNYAKDGRVQKYWCKSCNRIFSFEDRLPKTHVRSEVIGVCMDLYVKGLSYRVIKQQVLEQFKIKISQVTIYNWIQRYTECMKKYVDNFDPKLSAVWQMDETIIAFKGKHIVTKKVKFAKGGKFCWACIDTTTRYVLDMYLANSKDKTDGTKFFERIRNTIKMQPAVITTDGNRSYNSCIKEFYPEAVHLNIKKISLKPNTSFIERFNGTIKNRTKTMRGFKEFYSCQTTLTAFQIYYNFLRPHMALNDKTPAQAAGINIEFPERWVSLIRAALSSYEL